MSPALTLALASLTFFGILLLMSVLLKITGGTFLGLPITVDGPRKRKRARKKALCIDSQNSTLAVSLFLSIVFLFNATLKRPFT